MFDSSPLMAPKLKEMDDVIRRIYDKLIRSSGDRRTLLVCNSTSLRILLEIIMFLGCRLLLLHKAVVFNRFHVFV